MVVQVPDERTAGGMPLAGSGRHPSCWTLFHVTLTLTALTVVFITSMFSQRTLNSDRNTAVCGNGAAAFRVDQVVIVLLDALKSTVATGEMRNAPVDAPYFTYIREHLDSRAVATARPPFADSAGFVSVADAPTVTTQRLKAMTTGSIPAFIEAGTSFNSDAVDEDNLIVQMTKRNGASFLGDDTWLRLYPDESVWRSTDPFPSFDVRDLDTVDAGVLRDLLRVVRGEEQGVVTGGSSSDDDGRSAAPVLPLPPPSLVIGHFLGVDHAGHTFHARHEALDAKVRQLNLALRNITQEFREATAQDHMRRMLIVLGDHGMTDSGDHGGATPDETDTFLYSELFTPSADAGSSSSAPRALRRATAAQRLSQEHARRRQQDARELSRVYQSYKFIDETNRTSTLSSGGPATGVGAIHQIDVVPTVAVLAGVPIPRSSVARVIPEVLLLAAQHSPLDPDAASSTDDDDDDDEEASIRAALQSVLECNAAQLEHMIARELPDGGARYAEMRPLRDSGRHNNAAYLDALWGHLNDMVSRTRAEFGTMDTPGLWSAAVGALLTMSVVALLLLRKGPVLPLGLLAWTGVVGVTAARTRLVELLPDESAKSIVAMMFVVPYPLLLLLLAGPLLGKKGGDSTTRHGRATVLAGVLLFALRCCTGLSNSYIIDEETIVLFLFNTGLLVRGALPLLLLLPPHHQRGPTHAGEGSRWRRHFAAHVLVALTTRVVFDLCHRDRSFEEVPIQPLSPLRVAVDGFLLDQPHLVRLPPIAALHSAFQYVVYRTSWVHAIPLIGVLLSRVFFVGRPWLAYVGLTAWSMCLGRFEAALPRLVCIAITTWLALSNSQTEPASPNEKPAPGSKPSPPPPRGPGVSSLAGGWSSLPLLDAVILHLGAWLWFFATGFQTTFNAVDWISAFVGVPEYNMVAGGSVVFVHTAASVFIVAIVVGQAAPSFAAARRGLVTLALLQWFHLAAETCALAKHRRHLMVWDIYMPHYVFVLGFTLAALLAAGVSLGLRFLIRPG